MWFGRDAHKQLYDYIKPYSCSGDPTVKDNNTTAIVNSLQRNDIGTIEQLKAIIKRARDGGDPSVKGDYVKTRTIEYKLPFKTPEEFVAWRDKADMDDDCVDSCDICPIGKLCDLFCDVETELEIGDHTIGCAKMYGIILENAKKEDK